ncbi:type III secretion system translocon protein SseD [Chromobacterium phragmitis]|uniref:Type III secretion protein n=1 Tax=Chromobacterium phragmitis TaxID=2202141 RepID=A0ABV0IVA7_9NEIS
MTQAITSTGVGTAPLLSAETSNGQDSIAMLNELMVSMGQLFGKMRDLLRQYNQVQQANAFEMQKTAFDTRMEAISKDFEAKNDQAWAQIAGGAVGMLGGLAGAYSGNAALSQLGQGAGEVISGSVGIGIANGLSQQAQELQALSEFQHGLAEQQYKRADETLEKALRVSADLRDLLATLTQAHERIASSVRMN